MTPTIRKYTLGLLVSGLLAALALAGQPRSCNDSSSTCFNYASINTKAEISLKAAKSSESLKVLRARLAKLYGN
jgi:hypothetical protein